MGLGSEIGSLEIGKRADVIIVNLESLHMTPKPIDPVSALVYSAGPADVETVIIDGRLVLRERKLLTLDERELIRTSRKEAELLLARAGISH